MSKKNLLLYLFFIFVIMLVPGRVDAYEYTLDKPCYSGEANDFWHFKECKVMASMTDNSDREIKFPFTESNSSIYYGSKTVSYDYDNKMKIVCSSREPNNENVKVQAGQVCDYYYIKNNYNATCVYKSEKSDSDLIKINVSTSNDYIFGAQMWFVPTIGNAGYVEAVPSIDFKSFNYDGTCPPVITAEAYIQGQAKEPVVSTGSGDKWINIKEDSINNVTHPACTEEEIKTFKEEEAKLYQQWQNNYNNYLEKIKNKDFSGSNLLANSPHRVLTASLKKDIILEYMEYAHYASTYSRLLDDLQDKYQCNTLPEIHRICPDKRGCVENISECNSMETDEQEGCKAACSLCKTCEVYPEGESQVPGDELTCAAMKALKELADEAIAEGKEKDAETYENAISEANELGKELAEEDSYIFDSISMNWNFGEYINSNCKDVLGEELIGIIKDVFLWIKILAPVLLILFGSLDFAKAVFANDNDALKKATNNFVKRIIAAVAIFFLPTIINLVFDLEGLESLGVNNPLCDISLVVKK